MVTPSLCLDILKIKRRKGERDDCTNWQLWTSFSNFKEIDINWHHKGKIDNLKKYIYIYKWNTSPPNYPKPLIFYSPTLKPFPSPFKKSKQDSLNPPIPLPSILPLLSFHPNTHLPRFPWIVHHFRCWICTCRIYKIFQTLFLLI